MNDRLAGTLLVCTALLFWAANFTIGRAMLGLVPPVTLAFLRWAIAALIAVGLARNALRREWPIIRRHWKILALLSLFGIAGYNTIIYFALVHTTALNAVLIMAIQPGIVVLMAWLLYGDRVSPRMLGGVAVATLGALWIVCDGDMGRAVSLDLGWGDFLVVLAVTTYAVYITSLRRRPPMTELSFMTVTFVMGTAFLTPFFALEWATGHTMAWADGRAWAAIAYLVIFTSLVAYFCFNSGVARLGAAGVAPLMSLAPFLGVLLAVIFLGESLTQVHLVGGALTVGGIAYGNWPGKGQDGGGNKAAGNV